MTPKIKVVLGVMLLAPIFIVALSQGFYQASNPHMTPTEVSFEWGAYWLIFSIPAVAGAVLLYTGIEENEE